MGYELMGRTHLWLMNRLSREEGQGTVEYVGLILLMAVLIAGVVQASRAFDDKTIGEAIMKKLAGAVKSISVSGG